MAPGERQIEINSDADIVTARQEGRQLAEGLGFAGSELTIIATAISEVARNIVEFARAGKIVVRPAYQGSRQGIVIIARDEGPGISDITLAMQDGYSTSGGLGLGLPGVKRLMDEMEIVSDIGRGTTVTMKKWKH